MSGLYSRVKALVEKVDRPICHSRAREERVQRRFSLSSPPDSDSLKTPQVTLGTAVADSGSLPTRNPQVTVGTPCPHVDDPLLGEWYAEHPNVVCARCWLERGR